MKPPSIIDLPWRVGGQVGRTLYVETGVKDPDNFFGVVDEVDVATHIVDMHNLWLRMKKANDPHQYAGSMTCGRCGKTWSLPMEATHACDGEER